MVVYYNGTDLAEIKKRPHDVLLELAEKEHIKETSSNGIMIALQQKGYAVLPISLYDHGGITISVYGDDYFGTYAGFIYMDPETMKENDLSVRKAVSILREDIEEEDKYFQGLVYDAAVEEMDNQSLWFYNQDKVEPEWDFVESGYNNFVGYSDELLDTIALDYSITKWYDHLSEAVNDLKQRLQGRKNYTIHVEKTISADFTILADSEEEAKACYQSAETSTDYNTFANVNGKMTVSKNMMTK